MGCVWLLWIGRCFFIQTILYVELNCFALAVLLIIYLNIIRYVNKYFWLQKIFLHLILGNAIALVSDAAMWYFDGRQGPAVHAAFLAVTALYYAVHPIMCFLWYLYVDFSVSRAWKYLRRRIIVLAVPILAVIGLSIASVFCNNCFFYIGADNIYHRGKLFMVMAAVSFAYIIYSMILAVARRGKIRQADFKTLVFLPILPLLGGVAQTLFYGVSITWVCMTLGILVIFVKYQNSQLSTDFLTGLYNRRQLDSYLSAKEQSADRKTMAGLMIDIDYFKTINDTYGHAEGDRALASVADILKRTFRESDFVARYGGDEFVVIVDVNNQTDLEKALARLHANVESFNMKKQMPYKISLSIGSGLYEPGKSSAAEFMKRIDTLMYAEKERFRARNREIQKQ